MGEYPAFEKIIYTYTREASERGGQTAVDSIELGHNFHFEDKDALKFLKENSVKLSESSLSRMKGDINKVIADGVRNGAPIREITKDVKGIFNDFRGHEAERIARTEVARGTNNGALIGYDNMGIKVVEVYNNPGACPLCTGYHGDLMPVDQAMNFIPIHPNCYCFWLPRADIKTADIAGYKGLAEINDTVLSGLGYDLAFRRVSMGPKTIDKITIGDEIHFGSYERTGAIIEAADQGFIDQKGYINLIFDSGEERVAFVPVKQTKGRGLLARSGYMMQRSDLENKLGKAVKTYGF